jgi:hypothetical protein
MSHSPLVHHVTTEVVEGALTELVKQGGVKMGFHHAHGIARVGESAVRGAASLAPATVAAVGAALVTAAPLAAIATVGYLSYKLYKFIRE